jgi:glycosyltransferase involved in cell wall biosynthesis
VSRLVEKKGFGVLLEACRLLQNRVAFRCDIYGDGPLRTSLESQASSLGLEHAVTFHGARSHHEVLAALGSASVFTLPCIIARNGDRDGTPNALLEAMARGVPVISTNLSGIPEIIRPEVDGLLVPAGDATGLAEAIARIASDRTLAERLRQSAQQAVRTRFTIDQTAQGFLDAVARYTEAAAGAQAGRPGSSG